MFQKLLFNLVFLLLITLRLCAQENYNLEVRGHLTFPGMQLANISGYADSLGNEYALVGTSKGLSIVDVSNPEFPELRFTVNGVQNNWREIKTWEGFAYVVSEGIGSGLTIVDLRHLPDTVYSKVYRGDGAIQNLLSSNHALHIDKGYCYLYGSNAFTPPNLNNGGVLVLNLEDPWNPSYVGMYNERYVHDGYVYNDTLWACNVYDGFYTVIDFRNKETPVNLARQETPGGVTHNSWLCNQNQTVLLTDESSNSFLTSWDVRDLANISELDRYQTAPGSNAIVHNVHVLNDFAITSWYTEGVVIVDASRPTNLVEVAKNDFTAFEGDGFYGCWGVYPNLPSGNIVASDIENGLYVLSPTYIRASYLEGLVSDSGCGIPLDKVSIQIVGTDRSDITGLDGIFRTGTAAPGTYDILVSKPGYQSKTISNVLLQSGQVTELEVQLFSDEIVSVTGKVESSFGDPLTGAQANMQSNSDNFQFTTNGQGVFSKCNIPPADYTFSVGRWGYETSCEEIAVVSSMQLEKELQAGYYDDFQFHFGWESLGNSEKGRWVRAIPFGTEFEQALSNPNRDVDGDCNDYAYVTGNANDSTPGTDDVDDGSAVLRSPEMDLSTYQNPYIVVYRWFYNGGGTILFPTVANDTLILKLEYEGEIFPVKKITRESSMSAWVKEYIRVLDYLPQSGKVRFIAEAIDVPPGHLVEAGIDRFMVIDSVLSANNQENTQSLPVVQIFPNPSGSEAWLLLSDEGRYKEFSITDLAGRTHLQLKVSSSVMQLPSHLDSGMYYINLTSLDGKVRIISWIKQ